MSLKRLPFETTRLEHEREESGKVFTVRFNNKDLDYLQELKVLWGTDSDNGAIRSAVLLARNVTRSQYGDGLAEFLFKKKRVK